MSKICISGNRKANLTFLQRLFHCVQSENKHVTEEGRNITRKQRQISKSEHERGGDAEEGDGWERASADRQKKCERIPSLTDESAAVGGGGGEE